MDNNMTQDDNQAQATRPDSQGNKNKKTKIIIVSAIIVFILTITIITAINIIKPPKEHSIKSDEDVVNYLTSKYDDFFTIDSKENGTWIIKSETGYVFNVEERYDDFSNKYVAHDNYLDIGVRNAIHYFKSDYFTIDNNKEEMSISIKKDDKLLDISSLSNESRMDIVRLCKNITAMAPFKIIKSEYKDAISIKIVYSKDGKEMPLLCNMDDESFNDLLR